MVNIKTDTLVKNCFFLILLTMILSIFKTVRNMDKKKL